MDKHVLGLIQGFIFGSALTILLIMWYDVIKESIKRKKDKIALDITKMTFPQASTVFLLYSKGYKYDHKLSKKHRAPVLAKEFDIWIFKGIDIINDPIGGMKVTNKYKKPKLRSKV